MKTTKKAECKIDICFDELREINISVKEILKKIEFKKGYEIQDIQIEKEQKEKNIIILVKLKDKETKDKNLKNYLKDKKKNGKQTRSIDSE